MWRTCTRMGLGQTFFSNALSKKPEVQFAEDPKLKLQIQVTFDYVKNEKIED
jgi:hypothetical protein